jgi:RNA polymerase sigma-70 factor, ECF subfamily
MRSVAGAATLGNVISAIPARAEEASIVAELKVGSEDAYAWLIAHYHQPVYSLVYRVLNDPSDAADVTQEVFLKVFRGMRHFNGQASLKTWIYRIALHEASNQRRWWFRHKSKERCLEPARDDETGGLEETLADVSDSPFEMFSHEEVRARVEAELKEIPEPYRTTVVLRDIEELSYEEIAEILQVSLGTVKSRLVRGRDALKKRLMAYVAEAGAELGLSTGKKAGPARVTGLARKIEVAP